MSKNNISISLNEKDVKELVDITLKAEKNINFEIQNSLSPIIRQTKSLVKSKLSKGHGVRTGKYKKGITSRNLSKDDVIYFQVGGNKKTYKLTHLLELGHTKWLWGIKTSDTTKTIPHIEPGQNYADKRVLDAYKKAVLKVFNK